MTDPDRPRIFGDAPSPIGTRASVSLRGVRADDVRVTSSGCVIFGTASTMLLAAGETGGERLSELRAIARRVVALAEQALAAEAEVTP